MANRFLLGIDLGTSSTKSALYTTGGDLVADATADVPIYYPEPGVVEQKNEDFYESAARTVRSCVAESGIDPSNIAALSFDSQMAGVGTINEKYEPATRFDSWLDMRCEPYIDELDREHGDLITRMTGCAPTCNHGPKILWWKNERPEDYKRIAKFLMPSGYVAGKMADLSADDAFIDYTFLHFSGLSNAKEETWSDELCDLLDVDKAKLPKIVAPWEVVGNVSDEAAEDFGLAPGTPIAAGCGDTAAGALGAGIVRSGMLFDTAGTASVLAGCTDTYLADVENKALLTMRSVVPGLWNPLAYIGGGGQALDWYRNTFYEGYQDEDVPEDESLFDEMVDTAMDAPAGADGLFFSPHLGGRICPATPEMRGVWIGFSWSHDQPHFFRSILESIAYEYAFYLSSIRSELPDLELSEVRVIGGGARSDDWNQIKADVLGVPYQRLDRSEFGTWGTAMIAGKAAGIYDDLTEVALEHAQPAGEPVQPRSEMHEKYRPLVEKHIQLQETLEDTFTGPLNRSTENE